MNVKLSVVVSFVVLLGGALQCQAHPGPDFPDREAGDRLPPGPFPPFVVRALDLSDAQKQQLETIVKEQRARERAQRDKAEALHEQLHQAERAASFDEAAVRGTANALAALETERIVARIKGRFLILSILTPAQRVLAERLMPQRGELPPPPFCPDGRPGRAGHPGERPDIP